MTDHKQLVEQDILALHRLDEDFFIAPDGESASITGEMKVTVTRIAPEGGDCWLMTIHFPGGESFDAQFLRVRVLEQIGVKAEPNG